MDRPGPADKRSTRRTTSGAGGGRIYQAPALDKGLDILEQLSAERVPLSLSDLARALGRTSSEIFRMLVLLEQRGFVLKDSAGKYALSLRLYAMAHTHNPLEHLIRVAHPALRRLAETTRESCHLAVLDGVRLLVVTRAEAPTPIRLSVEVGATFDPGATTSGRLIRALTAGADSSAGAEHSGGALAAAAEQGWLAEPSLSHAGVHNLSVPIRIPGQIAALTIIWIPEPQEVRPGVQQLLPEALKCAAEISRVLGLEDLERGGTG